MTDGAEHLAMRRMREAHLSIKKLQPSESDDTFPLLYDDFHEMKG